jgi:NAD(P)-dependent dehydrogenase (short-subunit alcohol dehydrogenase family)
MLSGKVCVVAGGGHGLGEAVAIELGRHGATVVVNDLGSSVHGDGAKSEPAEETIEAVQEAGGSGMAHFGDVSSLEYTEELVADTVDEYDRIDGVVNFAGILRDSISYNMSGEEWDDVIRVHLRGHFALLRNVAAHWREQAGENGDGIETQRSFVSVSSRSALGNVGQANYSAAKAGVLGLTRATAKELARFNIRVNALMPTAYTRMIEDIPDDQQPFTEEEMPPEKVGPAAAYLLSDEAEDITGCTIRAAGDAVGVVSDPEFIRQGFREDGWTIEALADRFRSDVAQGVDLDRSSDAF